jgi:UDP-N-acetylmuramoylalanine--D-glutamate ligase
MQQFNHLNVLVLGLGDSGLAMVRWCVRFGAQVQVWDSRVNAASASTAPAGPPQAAVLAAELPQVRLLGGALTEQTLHGVQLVLKSPGLSPLDARLAPMLAQARATGVPVQTELDLFVRALADLKQQCGYAPKTVAITGTNGKTTTTAMAGLLIGRAGRRVALAGNIGPTLLETLSGFLDRAPVPPTDTAAVSAQVDTAAATAQVAAEPAFADAEAAVTAETPATVVPAELPPEAAWRGTWPEVWVLELSSFQLDGVSGFSPDAATVLNLTEDHLDWHGSMPAYRAAKAAIFGAVDGPTVMIVNRDDPLVEAMVPAPTPAKARFAKAVPRQVIRFGLDAPRRPGDFGLVTENGMAWLVRALEADETLKRSRKAAAEDEEIHLQRLMPADALRVRGRHNAANALAALALATAIGCPLAPMLHGLRDYTGEPHRLQFITSVQGVDAFDDSKGTNVGATVAAISGMGADRAPAKLLLILGGDGKGQDFAPLRAPLMQHARAVATLGRDASAIEAVLADSGLPLQRHASLEEATRWAFSQARAGDSVLLSPACASLDMFRNYAHRAEVFVAEVQRLASEQGELST